MNIIRTVSAIICAILGILCVGSVIFFTSGGNRGEGVATRMNKVFFQPRADAEVDLLIEKGVFTQVQQDDLRGFIRRLYISDGVAVVFSLGLGVAALGVALLAIAYSLWTSVQLSVLSKSLKIELADATYRAKRDS